MNICIPVTEDRGLDSTVSAHFGSAPVFMIVDTEALTCRPLTNHNQHHAHGMCQPLSVLAGENLQGIVVGGIGMGALMKCEASGIQVFRSEFPTVKETVEAFKGGHLHTVTPATACQHHGHDH